jgi:hypothetical protein
MLLCRSREVNHLRQHTRARMTSSERIDVSCAKSAKRPFQLPPWIDFFIFSSGSAGRHVMVNDD